MHDAVAGVEQAISPLDEHTVDGTRTIHGGPQWHALPDLTDERLHAGQRLHGELEVCTRSTASRASLPRCGWDGFFTDPSGMCIACMTYVSVDDHSSVRIGTVHARLCKKRSSAQKIEV